MDDRETLTSEDTAGALDDTKQTTTAAAAEDTRLTRAYSDITGIDLINSFNPPNELDFNGKYSFKKSHNRLASVGDLAQNKISQWKRNSRPSNFHANHVHDDEDKDKKRFAVVIGMIRDNSVKLFTLAILGILTCVYFFTEELQNDQLWGWEIWRIVIDVIVLWILYEVLRLVEIILMFLFEKISHWGLWKVYLVISACEYQISIIAWAVLGELFTEYFLKLDDEKKRIAKNVLACIIIACISMCVRNLILRRIFWTVHQKKLSQRMNRYNDLENSLRFLFDKFVVNRESLDAAASQGTSAEAQQHNHPAVDHQDTISDASYLEAIARIKEFEKKRSNAVSSHKSGKTFKLKSKSQAVVYAKALTATLDQEQVGHVSLNKLQKVMPEKLFAVFHRELKGHHKLTHSSSDHHYHHRSNIETRFFDHQKQSKDVHTRHGHVSVPVDLPTHGSEHSLHEDESDFYITESLFRTLFESLYVLGDALSKSSTSWTELSHGLQLLVDVIMWIFVIIVCSLYLGVNWSTLLVTTSTLVICAAFTIGAAISRLVLSMIFIFMTNAYEIGDTIAFETPCSDFYIVEQINVFSTAFRTEQNHKVIISNWKLAEAVVFNLSRNRVSKLDLYFQIPSNVAVQKFKWLRKEIAKFLKEHEDYYFAEFWMVTHDVPYSQNVLLQIRVSVKNSFEDSIALSLRRTEVLNCIKENITNLEIPYQFAESPNKKKDFYPFKSEFEKTADTQGHASIHLTPATGMAGH
jgi:small-conductance mechanosensitive channel